LVYESHLYEKTYWLYYRKTLIKTELYITQV
jgi:hypothetical protein